jgi:hypothetical protein
LNVLFSEKTFGVVTRIIVADFSYGEEEYQRIFAQIEDLDIGILSEFFINPLFALFYDNYQIIMTLNFMSSSQQRGNIPWSPKSPRENIQETHLGLDDGQHLRSCVNGTPSASQNEKQQERLDCEYFLCVISFANTLRKFIWRQQSKNYFHFTFLIYFG